MQDIQAGAPEAVRCKINNAVAVGGLNTGEINAMCVKSPDSKYAVLIGYGLFNFFHKYFKLTYATCCPQSVIHCSRKPVSALTGWDLLEYAKELARNYKTHGAPYGALILVDEDAPRLFWQSYSVSLSLCESFVLCHELAHFLCGHLDDERNLSPLVIDPSISKFRESTLHSLELEADLAAYSLARQAMRVRFPGVAEKQLFFPLVILFDLLHYISDGQCSTHPDARSRVLHVARNFYGHETSQLLEDSYHDHDLLRPLAAKPLRIRRRRSGNTL